MAKEFPSRIRKGDKLDGLPSAGWNAFVETWEKVNQSQTPGKGSGASRGASRLTAEVFAPGDIAADFPVLALTGPAYTPDHRAGVVYEGLTFDSETPATSTAASRLAVLQGPVLEDESREAVIQGPTWVKVNFTDAGHSFAGPKDGDSTRLASAEQGLPILWREDMPESLPADLWCVVRVGSPEPPASAVGVAQGNHLATAGEVQVAIAADYSVEGLGSTLYAANVHGYPVVQNQPVMLAQGEFPEWEPSTAYLADDVVVYDNGGGRVRWQRNSSGSSGATFDSGDWTELHEANGWMVAWPWHTVAKGTAQGNSNSGNGYANVDVELDIDTPVITVTAANPARVPTTSGDRMTLCVRPAGYAGAAHMVLWAESAVGTGGGGGDGDELVASQSGQTAGFLSAVLVDAPAQTAPWYAVDMVLSGATMYGRVNVPAASNDRLVRGVTTAAVKHSDPTYQMATPVGLADGDTPAGSPITVHAPIASYEAGATTWAARDHTNTRWIDSTPARFTLVKAQTTGAVAYGAHGWTVDNVQLLAGGRLPGTVQGNAALRTYRNNEWVWLIWSDENQRWEDFTPLQFRMISFLTKGAVANGAANFTVDNVVALCGGASPAASSATEVTVYGANKAYADNGPGLAAWNDSAQQFIDITPPAAVVPFDCIIRYGQSLTAGAWNDGTRKWTDGTGTVTLLTDNGDGTYNEGADQAVRWKANVAVSPPSGKAYRGAGLIVDGVYKLENVYTCDGVTWTSGE